MTWPTSSEGGRVGPGCQIGRLDLTVVMGGWPPVGRRAVRWPATAAPRRGRRGGRYRGAPRRGAARQGATRIPGPTRLPVGEQRNIRVDRGTSEGGEVVQLGLDGDDLPPLLGAGTGAGDHPAVELLGASSRCSPLKLQHCVGATPYHPEAPGAEPAGGLGGVGWPPVDRPRACSIRYQGSPVGGRVRSARSAAPTCTSGSAGSG